MKQARRWRSSNWQTAKGAQKGGLGLILRATTRARRIKGRTRHFLASICLDLLLNVVVHPADIQDRDGAVHLPRRARRRFPFIERIFADGGYAVRNTAMTVWRTGAWRAGNPSSDRTLLDLRCCLNGGSSNERSRGSVVTVAWLATSENATQRPMLHSSVSP